MYDVAASLFITLMNKVVITSITVRFTVSADSKKKGLKKVVAYVIATRSRDGKNVVIASFVNRLLKIS